MTNDTGRVAFQGFTPGPHNVTVVARGYFNNTITSDISKSNPVIVFLTEDPGQSIAPEDKVAIVVVDGRDTNSGVAGASVYIDDQFVGFTNNNEGKLLVDATGSHQITVAKDKFYNVTEFYNLEKGGTYKIVTSPWGGKMSLLDPEIFSVAFAKELTNGAVNTVKLSVVAMVLGLCIGLTMGLGRVSSNRLYRGFSSIYVEGVRGLPLTLQLFLIAYGLPFLMNDYFGEGDIETRRRGRRPRCCHRCDRRRRNRSSDRRRYRRFGRCRFGCGSRS
jgi:His/Glu/Gln/Arg/opine family amino acid ABC transporter permease subunit